jgi:multiple sugar transport system substrate-binding protein
VYIAEFAAAGWLEDLGTYFDAAKQAEYLSGTIEGATYQGKLVAFPWFTNASVMFYRTDVLSQLGAEVPSTYEGWMALAAQAKGINEVEYLGSFQSARSEALVCNWVEYVWNNGGDILNASGTPVINSANNIAATKIMFDMAQNYAPAGVTTYTEPESEQVFLDGKALFIRDWSGFWSQANREGSKVAGKVAATVLPVGPSGSSSHSCLGGLDLIINKHISAEQKAAAVKFLEYISSYETQKEFTLIAAQPPVLKAIYQDADILKQIPFYADFYNIISTGKSRPMSPQYARLSDAIQRNVHGALTGATTVEAALDALQNEAAEIK